MRTHLTALLGASLATLLIGCTAQTEDELTAEQSAALEAGIEHLAEHRAALPVADVELAELGASFVTKSQRLTACEHRGVVAGIWYDQDLQPVFEGSWFELGSSELGGTVDGDYHGGDYVGQVTGPELAGEVTGGYDGGTFVGQWTATVGEDGRQHDGELVGRYERRNSYGGYFFGVWTDCGPTQ